MRTPKEEKEEQFYRSLTSRIPNLNDVLAISFVKLSENGLIDPVTAGEHKEMFKEWSPKVHYLANQYCLYKDILYIVRKEHTSQEDWTPDIAISEYKVAADPAEEYPKWSQPLAAGDEYDLNAKVTHNNKKWHSIVDKNVWEPGVYGWVEDN